MTASGAPLVCAVEALGTVALAAGAVRHEDVVRLALRRRAETALTDRGLAVPGWLLATDLDVPPAAWATVDRALAEVTPHDLGTAYEDLLGWSPAVEDGTYRLARERRSRRRASGSFYTPDWLVDLVLDRALEPVLEARAPLSVTVCDPSCGAGNFILAAARRIALHAGGSAPDDEVVQRVHGIDVDPIAADLARLALRLAFPAAHPDTVRAAVTVADALLAPVDRRFDVVVGNPPFRSPLRDGARVSDHRRRVRAAFDGLGGPKADDAAYFLLLGARLRAPGGRLAMVLPDSLLSAGDAADVRRHLAAGHDVAHAWRGDGAEFAAAVVPAVVTLADHGTVAEAVRELGRELRPLAGPTPPWREGSWAPLVAAGPASPLVAAVGPRLSDVATITADYRDQYYGLRGAVLDDDPGSPPDPDRPRLVTTGLIDPFRLLWGHASTRFDRQRFERPVVDLGRLDPATRRWAEARLVPKLLVATQGRVLEVVVDVEGELLPCVPVISVVPVPGGPSLRALAALLASPPVHAHLAATKLGAGLSAAAIKVSAADLRALPAPVDVDALDAAGLLLDRLADDAVRHQFARLTRTALGLGPGDDTAWDAALTGVLTRAGAPARV